MSRLPWTFKGRVPYADAWTLQEGERARVTSGTSSGHLFILEHPPTISLGRGETGKNLNQRADWLRRRGFDIVETNRGGKVTYHGPGQLVAYPVVDLRKFGPGVRRFVAGLEETMIRFLGKHGMRAERKCEFPGVWLADRKIGSIGIHVRKQVSIHGLALNIATDLDPFNYITPCGIDGVRMTSMKEEGKDLDVGEAAEEFANIFGEVFDA